MCGIAGYVSFDGQPVEVALLRRMSDKLAHRGPDGEGLWVDEAGTVGFAHRRLAIIDLSPTASQPMVSADGALVIVFNGEIYNHGDVRRQLQAAGVTDWVTDHSDTEAVLLSFRHWGVECLSRLRGMFAFAIHDRRSDEVWLVRDRLGVKPLYVYRDRRGLRFASEIKALLADPDVPREVDTESLYHYLSFLTTPAPRTLFKGITKLAAATWMRVNARGEALERRYWDALANTRPQIADDAHLAEDVLNELRTAVKLHAVSDVPVGIFLSGGIDSSTNAALFAQTVGRQAVRTYSIGYAGDNPTYRNELHFARQMAEQIGAVHHERLLTLEDLLDFLPTMIRLQDEPIADPVCVPVYYVSKLARDDGVIVCQVGEGADELFCGYPSWRTHLRLARAQALPVPTVAKSAGLAALRFLGQDGGMPYEFLRRGRDRLPVFWGGAEAFSETAKRRLLSPRLNAELKDLTSWDALAGIRRRFEANAWEQTPLAWMSYLDLNLRLPELLLMRVDKMAMGVGLEARVPFLDHIFVELVMGISQEARTRNGQLKAVLKRAVRGIIPDNLIDRPKQGFGVPVHDWLGRGLGARMHAELDDFCESTDLLDRDAVRRVVESGDATRSWYLLNLALWHREYIA